MDLKGKTLRELVVLMWELTSETGKGDTKLNREIADEIFDRGQVAQAEAAIMYLELCGIPNPFKK